MASDPFGNPLSLQHEASAAAMVGFVEGFLGYTPRVLEVLAAAELDASRVVQAAAAALWMFSESPAGPPKARQFLRRAAAAALPATERERLFAQAVQEWVEGDMRAALATHERLAREYPRDLASLKLGQIHAFNLGESPTMLRLARHAAAAADDIAWTHGLHAFALEQCHRLEAAECAARRALAMRPDEPWAQHAIAHVMLTDGRLAEGAAFMAEASSRWQGLTSFMRSHNWWHLALFELERGHDDGALALYDREVWGVDKTYSQDQIGAVSLLARLELAGVDVGERWNELAPWLAGRTADHVQPFLDMQYLYGLARAGRVEADRLLANIEVFAPRAPEASREAWVRVALPACRGLVAHARARWGEAAEHLELALPRLASIGGSHAQRDLFEQICVDALQRSGRHAAVQNLLQPRANLQPQSVRLKRRLAQVDAALGIA